MLVFFAALVPIIGSLYAVISVLLEQSSLAYERRVREKIAPRVADFYAGMLAVAKAKPGRPDYSRLSVERGQFERMWLGYFGIESAPVSNRQHEIDVQMSGPLLPIQERRRQWVLLTSAVVGLVLLAWDAAAAEFDGVQAFFVEVTVQAAADSTWQRVAVSLLTVLAFALAAWGLFHAFLATRHIARDLDANVRLRHRLAVERGAEDEALRQNAKLSPTERQAAQAEIRERWQVIQDREASKRISFKYDNWPDGSEPLAEALVSDLSETTGKDLRIAGAGLFLGLVAGVWGAWIP